MALGEEGISDSMRENPSIGTATCFTSLITGGEIGLDTGAGVDDRFDRSIAFGVTTGDFGAVIFATAGAGEGLVTGATGFYRVSLVVLITTGAGLLTILEGGGGVGFVTVTVTGSFFSSRLGTDLRVRVG